MKLRLRYDVPLPEEAIGATLLVEKIYQGRALRLPD